LLTRHEAAGWLEVLTRAHAGLLSSVKQRSMASLSLLCLTAPAAALPARRCRRAPRSRCVRVAAAAGAEDATPATVRACAHAVALRTRSLRGVRAPRAPLNAATHASSRLRQPAAPAATGGSCPKCGIAKANMKCDGTGRQQGGIGVVPGFGWWPIKARAHAQRPLAQPCRALRAARCSPRCAPPCRQRAARAGFPSVPSAD
jgi:hypothetical protein